MTRNVENAISRELESIRCEMRQFPDLDPMCLRFKFRGFLDAFLTMGHIDSSEYMYFCNLEVIYT